MKNIKDWYKKLEKKDLELLQKAYEESAKNIENSAVFLALFTDEFKKEILTVLQLGLAVLMDKPIHLLVKGDTKVPENLKKIASIETISNNCSKDELEQAVKRILEKEKKIKK